MAYIKTLKENELIGGQDNTAVYPVSTTQAIYSQKPDGTVPEGIKHQRLEERLEDHEEDTRNLTIRQNTTERTIRETNQTVSSLDDKYTNITDELYSMVASLQVGGIALSNQFGNREDIGITQKALTRMFGALWDTIESLHPGHAVFDFILTVDPQYIFNEIVEDTVMVKADCTTAVSDFDSIKVYVNDELRAESRGIRIFETSVVITETSTIKVVGIILGKEIVKTAQVINEIPFFMGSGMQYQDVINEDCRKELDGSLEGKYDVVIKNTGEYLFVIIPISRKEEFRRAKLDMNGFEIPIEITEMTDYIVCKSLNTYKSGTYNIDIDINS